ncbi:transcriptional regulator ATRX-like isoform X2 [Aphidius gifuensis]|nr:transcriptional regulator ATRX-like isoform X2 [Aphidius gifuensis]
MTAEESTYRSKKFSDLRTIPTWECTCASCGNPINRETLHSHPVLGILQCQPCADQFRLLQSTADEDTIKNSCLICARSNVNQQFVCTGKNCDFSFCKKCIKRNAANTLLVVTNSDWRCFVCNTKPLWQRRGVCALMMASNSRRSQKNKSARSRNNDSDDSSEDSSSQRKNNNNKKIIKPSLVKSSSIKLSQNQNTKKKKNISVLLTTDEDDNDDDDDDTNDFEPDKIISTQQKKILPIKHKNKIKSKSSDSDSRIKITSVETIRKSQVDKSKIAASQSQKYSQSWLKPTLVPRTTSDSSSGKEFTQNKIVKEIYVPLQNLNSIKEDVSCSLNSSSSNGELSKTQVLNLRSATQKYFDDLISTSKKLTNDIETAKKLYMKKDKFKAIDASKYIIECKNIACSLIKRTEINEKKLYEQYNGWCKKSKVKNILKNSKPTKRRRTLSKHETSAAASSSSDDDDEEKEKNNKKIVKKSIEKKIDEKEPTVSECDSDQIFSDDESKKKSSSIKKNDKYNKNKKIESSGIESECSNGNNNSDIEMNLSSQKASKSNDKNKEHKFSSDNSDDDNRAKKNTNDDDKHNKSAEDMFAEDNINTSEPIFDKNKNKVTIISDDSADDDVFSSPDLKKRKSRVSTSGEAKTKKPLSRRSRNSSTDEEFKSSHTKSSKDNIKDVESLENLDDDQAKQSKKNSLSQKISDSSDMETTEAKNHKDKKTSEISDSDEAIDVQAKSKSQTIENFDLSGDEAKSQEAVSKGKKSNELPDDEEATVNDNIDNHFTSDEDEIIAKKKLEFSESSDDEEITEKKTKAIESSKSNDKDKLLNTSDADKSTDVENNKKVEKEPKNKNDDSDATEVDVATSKKVVTKSSDSEDTEPIFSATDKTKKLASKNNSDLSDSDDTEPLLKNKLTNNKPSANDNSDDDQSTDIDDTLPKLPIDSTASLDCTRIVDESPKNKETQNSSDDDDESENAMNKSKKKKSEDSVSTEYEEDDAEEPAKSKKNKSSSSEVSDNDLIKKKQLLAESSSDGGDTEPVSNNKKTKSSDTEKNAKKKLLNSDSSNDDDDNDTEVEKINDDSVKKTDSKTLKALEHSYSKRKKTLSPSSQESKNSKKPDKSSDDCSQQPDKKRRRLDLSENKNNEINDKTNKKNLSSHSSASSDNEAKKKLLNSSSSDSDNVQKNSTDKSSDDKNISNNKIVNLKNSPIQQARLNKKAFRRIINQFYKNNPKLKLKCTVRIERIPPRILRKHAKALKKSKEYVENKKLKSLVTLADLEKNRNRDREIKSSSDEETSTSTRNRKKKTKETEETLMDHLNNINNGDTMEVDNSLSDDNENEEQQNLRNAAEIGDLGDAAEMIAHNNLLRDTDSNSGEELERLDDSNAEDEEENETEQNKKTKTKKSKTNDNDDDDDDDEDGDDDDNGGGGDDGGADKSRWRRNNVLTKKFTSSDSDEQAEKAERKSSGLKSSQNHDDDNDEEDSNDDNAKIKKKRVRKQRLDSDSDANILELNSNSDSDFETTDNNKKSDNEKSNKKNKTKRKKNNNSSDSDSSSTTRNKQKAKRRRIKAAETDSDDSSIEELNNSQGTPGKSGRKNIRRVLKDTKVADDTKQAAMQEEERLKRMAERQKIYNEMYEVRLAGEKKVDNLVLDFDEESKEELLSVHENLVKKLKPHQAQGIKFMWDACFESLERAKTTKGSGAILAHCMGLGKSFQIVTLSHTLLSNCDKTGVKTVMVVCPLSTVLNWVNEFRIWLKEINGDEDEIEVYEMTKMKKNFERKYVLEKWQKTGGALIIGYEMFRNLSNGGKKVPKKIRESFYRCLVEPGPDLVVCDEGHLLKSENTAISKAMSKIRTLRRIVLTGTPLQNNLVEYHCMVQFVKPNLLGTKKEFLNRFVNPINNGQFDDSTEYDVKLMKKRAHVLHKMLEGSVQRFDYSVLTPFLPPKQEYVIFIKLTEVQVKLYQYYIENLARRHRAAGGSLFADFQSLQRVWTHPICIKLNADKDAERKRMNNDTDSEGSLKDFIDDDDDDTDDSSSSIQSTSSTENNKKKTTSRSTKSTRANPQPYEPVIDEQQQPGQSEWWSQFVEDDYFEDMRISSKLLLLFDILKESEQIGDKVLVFSQSLYSLTLIEKFLRMIDDETQKGQTSDYLDGHSGNWSLGLDYFRLDGSTSTENRSLWCKLFNRPTNTRARLFLISTRAGGLGINLTAANRVIIFDASWNPSHDVQSIFRIYRFGQKKPCYVYRLLAAGTMEEKIYNRQVTKLSLSCRVVDEQQIERHYTNNDLAQLYTYEPCDEETSLQLPKDRLLAEIFLRHKKNVRNYHEHDSLLENKAEEELDEEERKQAWREYEDEKAGRRQMGMPMMNYQEQLFMQQINAQMLSPTITQRPEFEQIRALIQKDYPNASPEQQMQITKQAMINMYNYIENQHFMGTPVLPVGRPPMQMQHQPVPLLQQQLQQPKLPNPTNTLANMLAQQEYARHHNTSAKKLSAQHKQMLYAQQHGNYRTVPNPIVQARVNPAPTVSRPTNSAEPELVELDDTEPTPAPSTSVVSTSRAKKYQEE